MRITSAKIFGAVACIAAVLILWIYIRGNDRGAEKSQSNNSAHVQWVDPNQVQIGPIRHDKLTDKQMRRIKELHAALGKYDDLPLEKWIDNFKRDANPDREIAIWEAIQKSMATVEEHEGLTGPQEKEAYKIVLMSSMAPYQEARPRMSIDELPEDQIRRIYGYFSEHYQPL